MRNARTNAHRVDGSNCARLVTMNILRSAVLAVAGIATIGAIIAFAWHLTKVPADARSSGADVVQVYPGTLETLQRALGPAISSGALQCTTSRSQRSDSPGLLVMVCRR
jgi:hypothetical protein